MSIPSRGSRAVLVFSLVAAMLLITIAGCQANGVNITGPWHNTELNEVVRFHEDGTVVIRTAEGDFEAKYVYDSKSAQGVITLNGTAIDFTPTGDSLMLTMGGTQSEFKRGDMQVALAQPTEAPTEAPTLEPTEAPTQTPTEEPLVTLKPGISLAPLDPFPDISFHPLPSDIPAISLPPMRSGLKPGDIFGGLTGITGDWYYEGNHEFVLALNADMTFTLQTTMLGFSGTYTYDKTSKTGVLDFMGNGKGFTVSGDTLTWEDGMIFTR